MYVFKKPSGITRDFANVPSDASSLEFSLHHTRGSSVYNEENIHYYRGEGKKLLSLFPYYANHPLVQEAVKRWNSWRSAEELKSGRGIKYRRWEVCD